MYKYGIILFLNIPDFLIFCAFQSLAKRQLDLAPQVDDLRDAASDVLMTSPQKQQSLLEDDLNALNVSWQELTSKVKVGFCAICTTYCTVYTMMYTRVHVLYILGRAAQVLGSCCVEDSFS